MNQMHKIFQRGGHACASKDALPRGNGAQPLEPMAEVRPPVAVLMADPMPAWTSSIAVWMGAKGSGCAAGAAGGVAGARVVAGGAVEGASTGVPGFWLGQAGFFTK